MPTGYQEIVAHVTLGTAWWRGIFWTNKMQAKEVAVLIMAGGLSRRFGTDDKLLAELGGLSLGLHAASHLATLNWAQKVAVARPPLTTALEDLGYQVIEPAVGNGLSDNLAMGAKSLSDVAAVLIILADMPFISKAHVQTMLEAATSHTSVVCSCTKNVRSPPVLIGRQYFPDLLELSGNDGAKTILKKAGSHLIEVDASMTIAVDIDTLDDYERWQASISIRR